jgi:hypothetical protein
MSNREVEFFVGTKSNNFKTKSQLFDGFMLVRPMCFEVKILHRLYW